MCPRAPGQGGPARMFCPWALSAIVPPLVLVVVVVVVVMLR